MRCTKGPRVYTLGAGLVHVLIRPSLCASPCECLWMHDDIWGISAFRPQRERKEETRKRRRKTYQQQDEIRVLGIRHHHSRKGGAVHIVAVWIQVNSPVEANDQRFDGWGQALEAVPAHDALLEDDHTVGAVLAQAQGNAVLPAAPIAAPVAGPQRAAAPAVQLHNVLWPVQKYRANARLLRLRRHRHVVVLRAALSRAGSRAGAHRLRLRYTRRRHDVGADATSVLHARRPDRGTR